MRNNSKKILIFLFCLSTAILIVIAQNGKRAGQPYTASCTSKEDRCQKCRIYELQMQRMQGKITDEQFKNDSLIESKYISKNCKDGGGGGGKNGGGGSGITGSGDSCRYKRDISYRIESDGRLVFFVYRNEFKNGKCQPTNLKTDILELNNSRIKNYSKYKRSLEKEFVSYSASNDINMPFRCLDNYDAKWVNQSYDYSYPDSSFAFLFPDSASNSVYLIKPKKVGSKEGVATILPDINPKWFNYYDEKKNKYIEFVFDDLVTIFAHDPNAKVIKNLLIDNPKENTLFLCLKGMYNGKSFILCTGYSKGIYFGSSNPNGIYNPIRLSKSYSVINNSVVTELTRNTTMLETMIGAYENNGTREYIESVLPSNYSSRPTPKYSIGSPETSDCFTEEIKQQILSGSQLDFLTTIDDKYYSWKNESQNRQAVDWLNSFDSYCQLRNLGIVDNDLRIVGTEDSKSIFKLIFFFKNSAENLYCWTIKDGRLKENIVLNGRRDIFQLTGIPCLDYLNNLKTDLGSSEEEKFFLDYSDKNSYELLDGFNLDNRNERTILWTTEHQPSLIKNVVQVNAKKLGEKSSENKLVFLVADSKIKTWNTFQTRYSKEEWIRKKIISLINENNNLPVDFWLGSGNRFGMCRYRNTSKYVTVYLDNQHREIYGERPFSEILKLVSSDEIIYKGNNSQPTDIEFFESCLAADWNRWNKNIWRANPLGYFDRKINY